LKFKDQVLAIIIIPLILFVIFTMLSQYYTQHIQDINFDKNKNIKDSINKLKVKKEKIDNINIIKYMDKQSEKFNIKVLDIKFNNKKINLKAIGKYKDILNFIIYIENNIQIKQLSLIKNDNNIALQFEGKVINIQEHENIKYNNTLANPFISMKNKKINNSLNLTAIFGNEICINEKWYTVGQKVNKYKIIRIESDYVELSSKNKKTIVRIEE